MVSKETSYPKSIKHFILLKLVVKTIWTFLNEWLND